MKVNKLDHISIAVRNLDAARKIWEPVLGKSAPDDAYVDEAEKIRLARYWLGEVAFELLELLVQLGGRRTRCDVGVIVEISIRLRRHDLGGHGQRGKQRREEEN